MARKKTGNRAAASQAKAKDRARRKTRSTGPSIAESAYIPPAESEDQDDPSAELELETSGNPEETPADVVTGPTTVATAPRRSMAAQRRARQEAAMSPAGGLRREIALIGSITLVVGIMLVVLKTSTDLGA